MDILFSLPLNHRIVEYPELEGALEALWVQLLSPHSPTQTLKLRLVSQHSLSSGCPRSCAMPTALWGTACPFPNLTLLWHSSVLFPQILPKTYLMSISSFMFSLFMSCSWILSYVPYCLVMCSTFPFIQLTLPGEALALLFAMPVCAIHYWVCRFLLRQSVLSCVGCILSFYPYHQTRRP